MPPLFTPSPAPAAPLDSPQSAPCPTAWRNCRRGAQVAELAIAGVGWRNAIIAAPAAPASGRLPAGLPPPRPRHSQPPPQRVKCRRVIGRLLTAVLAALPESIRTHAAAGFAGVLLGLMLVALVAAANRAAALLKSPSISRLCSSSSSLPLLPPSSSS